MKRLLVPVALIAASTLVALVLAEIALRVTGFSSPVWYRPDPVLGWTLRPGMEAWYTQEGKGLVRVNAAGMRDREHRVEKPGDVYRIAVLGDSYAEARQVAAEEAFWAVLPKELQRCGFAPGKRIEVLNFGTSGYGTAQELAVLESRALAYKPDLVLLQFTNGNDVRNNSFALEDEKTRPFYRLNPDGSLWRDDSFVHTASFSSQISDRNELLRRIADHSRVVQLLRSVQAGAFFRKAHADGGGVEQGMEPVVLAEPREPRWEEAWTITERLIAKTADTAKRAGAGFVVVTVPYAIQVHPDASLRKALQAKLGVADLFYPDKRIAEFGKRNGIRTVPLALEMQRLAEERKAYFHGFENIGMGRGHWNAEGHRTAAELIAKDLCAAQS
jgi:lysophospholipase L1-like esterase